MPSIHRIQKDLLHIDFNGTEAEAFALQQRLASLNGDRLLAAIEQVFDRIGLHGETWFFERLEIDAGSIPLADLERDLPSAIAHALGQALQEQMAHFLRHESTATISDIIRTSKRESTENAFLYFLANGRLPWSFQLEPGSTLENAIVKIWDEDTAISSAFVTGLREILASAQARCRLYLQFSEDFLCALLGHLSPELVSICYTLIAADNMHKLTDRAQKLFKQRLWDVLFSHAAIRRHRNEQQIIDELYFSLPAMDIPPENETDSPITPVSKPDDDLVKITDITAQNRALAQRVINNLRHSNVGNDTLSAFDHEVWQVVASCSDRMLTAEELVIQALKQMPKLPDKVLLSALEKICLSGLKDDHQTLARIDSDVNEMTDPMAPDLANKGVIPETNTEAKTLSSSSVYSGGDAENIRQFIAHQWPDTINRLAASNTEVKADRLEDHFQPLSERFFPSHNLLHTSIDLFTESDFEIYIDNAGLVLLHPFLSQFFTALSIAEEAKLTRPDRALCLLHYLTTGQTSAPEHELVLPKVLCNIALDTPVARNVELTNDELEEADALLTAVIKHWDVLKNTGINGLRGTFLLRAGKLSLREDGDWLLQVESKTYDILMSSLPWGIGLIKLPWMQRLLWVEWDV